MGRPKGWSAAEHCELNWLLQQKRKKAVKDNIAAVLRRFEDEKWEVFLAQTRDRRQEGWESFANRVSVGQECDKFRLLLDWIGKFGSVSAWNDGLSSVKGKGKPEV